MVGFNVVGSGVGGTMPNEVGVVEGTDEGLMVGFFVIRGVGVDVVGMLVVGLVVGWTDGCKEGHEFGCCDGCEMGRREGCELGRIEGCREG